MSDDSPKFDIKERKADGSWGPPEKQEPSGEVFDYFQGVWARGESKGLGDAIEAVVGLKNEGTKYGPEDHPDVIIGSRDGGVEKGLEALNVPKSCWWNPKKLCLVITDGETKVGFTSSLMKVPFQGLHWVRTQALVDGLRLKMTVH